MTHYLAILIQSDVGEWRIVLPDLPGCEAKGMNLDDARQAAISMLPDCIKNNGSNVFAPRDLSDVERDREWLARNRVDLSKAVITMISLAA
jgi:hypothetical protein